MKSAAALLVALVSLSHAAGRVEYVKTFENANHPEIAYWFFAPNMLEHDQYLAVLNQLTRSTPYTLVFLTARNGVNFYDFPRMHPVFRNLVEQAHRQGLKIGLQLWDNRKPVAPDDMERAIVEGEVTLDAQGQASYTARARHIRPMSGSPVRSELYRGYAFQKDGDGFYVPGTLRDITSLCASVAPDAATVKVDIHAGPALAGRTVYLMTQHYYNFSSNHGADAAARFLEAIQAYRDIPFDGVALDEYTNLHVTAPWEMEKPDGVFRERTWSPAMAREYQSRYGTPLDRTLFDMRYAPQGRPEVRIHAIDTYMDTMRDGPLHIEEAVYRAARSTFGPQTYAGFHNTHHNALPFDEIWATGLNWWTLPRYYGHTDENSPLATQMGIAMSAPANAMYNMFYDKSLDRIASKALDDLRYGIRTIYHAINDVQGWGVSVEKPEALAEIGPVERCARLLNRFNPSLPRIRLLVVFGMEALSNWYPNPADRGVYDINDKLQIEEKAMQLWNSGYPNALVASDVIVSGRLKLDAAGKPVMNGHTFDALIYLYPEYAREPVLRFLEQYAAHGGELLIEGRATRDFEGRPIAARFDAIAKHAGRLDDVASLGIPSPVLPNGCQNEDGSSVFTDFPSLRSETPAIFELRSGDSVYSGEYHGLAVIAADPRAGLQKLAASGFTTLRKNGTVLLRLPHPADIFIERSGGDYGIVIAGGVPPLINQLAQRSIAAAAIARNALISSATSPPSFVRCIRMMETMSFSGSTHPYVR
jgi:hypothetical protein